MTTSALSLLFPSFSNSDLDYTGFIALLPFPHSSDHVPPTANPAPLRANIRVILLQSSVRSNSSCIIDIEFCTDCEIGQTLTMDGL